MPDQTQNKTPEQLRSERLAAEIKNATGIGMGDLSAPQAPKPQGAVVRSMQADIQTALHAPTKVTEPTDIKESLSGALQDIMSGKSSGAASDIQVTNAEAIKQPQDAFPTSYREAIEDAPAMNVNNTPITGMSQLQVEQPSAIPQQNVIHTLKYDVQDLVKKRKVSMIRAVALETDKNANAQTISGPIESKKQPSNAPIYLLSTVFFVLGAVAIGSVFYAQSLRSEQQKAESEQVLQQNSMIFYEHVQPFDMTDLQSFELRGGLAQAREQLTATLGSMTLVQLTLKQYDKDAGRYGVHIASFQEFLQSLHPRMPRSLLNTLQPEYMIAIHTTEENTPLILMQANGYDTAFSGMIAWEDTMAEDLAPFFPSRGAAFVNETSHSFEDLSMDNIDARVMRAPNKKVRVIYAILEKNVIAITNNIYTLKEVASNAAMKQN
jgi:hypothetical protein